ncbi:hypothetical protein [Priestia koreensis]|uniref:Uncharacterized protein n=1 Tax=Priestia koreensis TaxID=284581 RepID=A0A0M0LI44_9BACI|nr:hypothetical protein [Priestia koreensis]KOO50729.1 hypothetical protein AMD01_03035 [Priestia koreensis]
MKTLIWKSMLVFLLTFVSLLIAGKIFFPSEVNTAGVVRALFISLGSTIGWGTIKYSERKKV